MSGGVDSCVACHLLLEEGYEVIGVTMNLVPKGHLYDEEKGCCSLSSVMDAKIVAEAMGVKHYTMSFREEFDRKVIENFVREYSLGYTPNPCVACNKYIKFNSFVEKIKPLKADFISTGHYAKVEFDKNYNRYLLKRAKDSKKDQTYFLYRVTSEALAKTVFPLGNLTKPEVRQIAKDRGLWTARKKESMGVCFVGNVGMREFLSQYITTRPGDIIDKESGRVLGRHDGAIFYTLGQRHGLDVGGGLPYYVVGKNMDKNEVYISRNINDEHMWRTEIKLTDIHWINQPLTEGARIQVRLRHRGALINAIYSADTLHLESAERAVAPGQSAVVYRGEECLGGGIMSDI